MVLTQPALIPGYYFCQNCRQTVPYARKTRRFWLCDACWARVMPDWGQESIDERDPAWYADNPARREKIQAYWKWYGEMERRYPSSYRPMRAAQYMSWRNQPAARDSSAYNPTCQCGRPKEPLPFGEPGLFGGPYSSECPFCTAKSEVESVVSLHAAIHPEWDDEDWLDMLYRVFPRSFKLGVLPDYWFELKRKQ